MAPIVRSLIILTTLAATSAACSSENSADNGSSAANSALGTDTTVAPIGDGDGGSGESPAPLCLLATADDFAALFPGATAGNPDPSSNSCTIAMVGPGGSAFFLMLPSLSTFDGRLQQDTDLGFTISQLDGIGERAYYARGNDTFPQADVIFEKAGTTYAVSAAYANSGQTMVADPTLQDTLMRIAAAWAASI